MGTRAFTFQRNIQILYIFLNEGKLEVKSLILDIGGLTQILREFYTSQASTLKEPPLANTYT